MFTRDIFRLCLLLSCTLNCSLNPVSATVKPRFTSHTVQATSLHRDVLMYSSRRFGSLIENSLEQLPYGLHLYSSIPINNDGVITAGTDVFITGVFKLNVKEICKFYDVCPETKFSWNIPAWVQEAGLDFADIRVFVDHEPVRFLKKPDDEVYISTLTIEQAGGIHTGLWGCSFKFFSRDNGKLDRKELAFRINVEGLDESQYCGFDDHCYSGSCVSGKCMCSEKTPVYDQLTNKCHAEADLHEYCDNNQQCQSRVTGSVCSCMSYDPMLGSGSCRKVCNCDQQLVAVRFASNINQCLPPAKLDQKCQSSDQCAALDKGTYCTFDQKCGCRDGASCSVSRVPVTCSKDTDCMASEYCSDSRCKPKKGLAQACSINEECSKNDSKSICEQGTCKCIIGYKQSKKGTCIEHDRCFNNNDCDDQHGYCQSGLCIGGTRLGQGCRRQSACRAADRDSFCSANNQCECKPRYRQIDSICLSDVQCLSDVDCLKTGSRCVDGWCYRRNDGECSDSNQCLEQSLYSFCSTVTKKCECDSNFEKSSNNTCIAKGCLSDTDCSGGMVCRGQHCTCKDTHELNVWGYCMKKKAKKADESESTFGFLFKWFEEWTWQAYLILAMLALLTGLLLGLIACLIISILGQPKRPTRDFGVRGTVNSGISHSAETIAR